MHPGRINKSIKKELLMSETFCISHLVNDRVFCCGDNRYGAILKVDGIPFHTAQANLLNDMQQRWHSAINHCTSSITLYVMLHRQPIRAQLLNVSTNFFANDFDQDYSQKFKKNLLYQNSWYLIIVNQAESTAHISKGLSLMKRLSKKILITSRQKAQDKSLSDLNDSVKHFKNHLAAYKVTEVTQTSNPNLLGILSLIINGGNVTNYLKADSPTWFAKNGETALHDMKKLPNGHLSQFLSEKRLFFGYNTIQWEGHTKNRHRFGAVLSIKQYPTESHALIFDFLLQLPASFISVQRFTMIGTEEARKKIKTQKVKFVNTQDDACSQQTELDELLDAVISRKKCLGLYHNSLLLIENSKEALENIIDKTVQASSAMGVAMVRETLGLESAFWSQLPGNLHLAPRVGLISSENFTDFNSFHQVPIGYCNNNHLGSALCLLETPAKTPYFFNCHTPGAVDNPSPGHTLVFGANNAGKTVLLSFLATQLQRYQGQLFVFDRNRGMEIVVRALGGQYTVLSPSQSVRLNPFQLPDSVATRQFCWQLLCELAKRPGETLLAAELAQPLKDCVDYAFGQLLPTQRQLSHALDVLPIDFPRMNELNQWLAGKGNYGYLFDNKNDTLQISAIQGFDLTHFLDNEPAAVLNVLSHYLLYVLESKLDGVLTTIIFDEGWQCLDSTFWQAKLKTYLATLRKLNAHVIFATQSPDTVASSAIAPILIDNSPTHIFFPNVHAKGEVYCDRFHLTEEEHLSVKSLDPTAQQMLIKQSGSSVIAQLNLAEMASYLKVFSANAKSIIKLDKMRKIYGDMPEIWLPYFLNKEG